MRGGLGHQSMPRVTCSRVFVVFLSGVGSVGSYLVCSSSTSHKHARQPFKKQTKWGGQALQSVRVKCSRSSKVSGIGVMRVPHHMRSCPQTNATLVQCRHRAAIGLAPVAFSPHFFSRHLGIRASQHDAQRRGEARRQSVAGRALLEIRTRPISSSLLHLSSIHLRDVVS